MKQYARFIAALGFVALFIPTFAAAQSLSITSPVSSIDVKEGDDFATQVLQNPWDFNERRDIGWEENFAGGSVEASGGVWSGTNETAGGYVFPLFPGFKGGLFAEGVDGDKTLPRHGINFPIDASKYTQLSWRARVPTRTNYAVYWEKDSSKPEYWPDGSNSASNADGFFHWSVFYPNSGYHIYNHDMSNLAGEFASTNGSWSGNIFALRLDLSPGSPAGETLRFDWVRLVDPNSGDDVTITWDSANIDQFAYITVYVDNDTSGFNGTPMARFVTTDNPGSYTFNSAILPPGDYFFYVGAQVAGGGVLQGSETRSGYSARVRVGKAPEVVFSAPTRTSGADYATSELGNPWDMDGEGDVPNLNGAVWPDEWRQFSNNSFNNGVFQAQANPPLPGNTESDVQVHMNVPASTPIDPNKYRYLAYKLSIDETDYPTISDKIREGWVSRPVFWNTNIITDAGRPSAHTIYEGEHVYTVDLWDESILEFGQQWRSFSRIQNFRIDPLETTIHTWFFLDYVTLHADNRATDGSYPISLSVSDSDSSSVTVSLFYDTDNSGFNGTLITTLSNVTPGETLTHNWDTSGLDDGDTFFVYAVVSDGSNTTSYYAPATVTIGEFAVQPRSVRPKMDYDGDGKSDQVVYRPTDPGMYFVNNSSTAAATSLLWGSPAIFTPIQGDFDGDGKTDLGLVTDWGIGVLYWYVTRSSDGILYTAIWGFPTDQIVIGDYNGNGRDEVAVYRDGAWFVLDESGAGFLQMWGLPTDVPRPGDYDGDGRTDYAVWRESEGNWYIINSSNNGAEVIQWGLPNFGDIPMVGDFDGDGRDDTAIFREGFGMWFVRHIADGSTTSLQWGLPGDLPLTADFNGDARSDYVVFRESNGTWYINDGQGVGSGVQFGLPGDVLPVNR